VGSRIDDGACAPIVCTVYSTLHTHGMLASWDAPYNHVRSLVLAVVEGVRVACG